MNNYDVWWKVTNTGQILHVIIPATNKEDAKNKVLQRFGYKVWDIKFTKTEIIFGG